MTELVNLYAAQRGLMLSPSVSNAEVDAIDREIRRAYKRGVRDVANFLDCQAAVIKDKEIKDYLLNLEAALRKYALECPNGSDPLN